MKNFPSLCVDNFYSNPEEVRKFALAQEYQPHPQGKWPGTRTKDLSLIDNSFASDFCNKIFSLYYNIYNTEIKWRVSSFFQKIEAYDLDPTSIKNKGWIHFDDAIFAGIIYLNKEYNHDSGTVLYDIKDKNLYDKNQQAKKDFFQRQDTEGYEDLLLKHNSNFVETVRYNNKFNRLIMFDSEVAHTAHNFFNNSEPRLTQVFFVENLEVESGLTPLHKSRNFL